MNISKTLMATLSVGIAGIVVASDLPINVEADALTVTGAETAPISIDSVGRVVTVTFADQTLGGSPPVLGAVAVGAALTTDAAAFSGDYTDSDASGILFSLASDSEVKPNVSVIVEVLNSRKWYCPSSSFGAVGTPSKNNVSLDFKEGWTRDGQNSEALWLNDLKSVKAVGVRVLQNGLVAQSCEVSGFRLLLADQVVTPEAVLDDRILEWFGKDREAVLLDEVASSLDTDGDGITDLLEISMTQTDQLRRGATFGVSVAKAADGQVFLSWDVVAGGVYQVVRSTQPGKGYTKFGAPVVADETGGFEWPIDSDGDARYFYRVKMIRVGQ